MAWTESELDNQILRLERALGAGVKSLTFPDGSGSNVTYNTPAEIERGVEYFKRLKAQLVAAATGARPRTRRLLLSPSSGITC